LGLALALHVACHPLYAAAKAFHTSDLHVETKIQIKLNF